MLFPQEVLCTPQEQIGLTFLNFFPETNGLCWGTAAGKEEKKKPLFYYSEVHFNLHKRHCVCDGLHEGKHYSPASSARKKNKGDMGRIKNNLLQCRILIRGPWCLQSGSRWSSEHQEREGVWYRVRGEGWEHRLGDSPWSCSPLFLLPAPSQKPFHKRSGSVLKFILFLFPWKDVTESHFSFWWLETFV